MIQVDLSPGGKKRSGRRRRSRSRVRKLSLPSFKGLQADPWIAVPAVVALLVLGGMGFLFQSVAGVADELEVEIEAAVNDSARYADLIERTEGLQARRDTIAERVALIQEIDGERYVWPRLLDEVARALPDFTWLTQLTQVTRGEDLVFRIEGAVGNYFALTSFMENLEASPFIRNVRLVMTDQVVASNGDRFIYQFILEASKSEAPSEILETVPLFEGGNRSP